ncbi:MAG: hypothetical protein ACE5HS_00375 [bacterium]
MFKPKQLLKILVALLVVCGIAVFLAYQNKYYVKKYIKSHKTLYTAAQKIAEVKYNLTRSHNKKDTANGRVPDLKKNKLDWHLTFDAAQSQGKYKRFWGNIGYESFKNGILNGPNRQLFEMIRDSNSRLKGAFRYLRAHNLFSDGQPPWGEGCVKVSLDAAGNLLCDWTTADRVFDTILKLGMRPIVEFGFMPDILASIPERRQKWGRANISPPNDYVKWQELVHKTVKHLVNRYGEEEISNWYFEVWNEPDLGYLFWVEDAENKPWGDFKEYLKLYDHTVYGAKTACPSIRIGGPASAGGFLDNLLEHVLLEDSHTEALNASRIDFVSSHSYGYVTEKNRKGMNIKKAVKWKLDRVLEHDHSMVREKMKALPFLLTETGFGAQKKGKFNNNRFTAAWLVKLVSMLFDMGDNAGKQYRPTEFVYWSDQQVQKDFESQRGIAVSLKSKQGRKVFKRPIYNAFEMLGHLSDERITLMQGARLGDPVFAVATKNASQSVEILLYHLNERDESNARSDSLVVSFTVLNLPFQRFQVRHYLIDEMHSNVYTAWKNLQRPKMISQAQMRKLAASDDLEYAQPPWHENSNDQSFTYQFKLQPNSVALFVLTNFES